MLWILRLALCAMLAVATAAEAHGEPAGDATATSGALTRSGVARAKVDPDRAATTLVLPRATKIVIEPRLQGAVVGDGLEGGRSGRQGPGASGSGESFHDSGGSDPETGLRYAFSPRISLGVNYRWLTEEDLSFEVAESGSLQSDYDNHSLILQARWEF